MRFKALTMSAYKSKVEELTAVHQPWAETPVQWRRGGCAGSSPERRGYPCSLWTLFHTLLASSLDKVTVCSTLVTCCHVPRAGSSLEPGRHEHRGQGHGRVHKPPLQL